MLINLICHCACAIEQEQVVDNLICWGVQMVQFIWFLTEPDKFGLNGSVFRFIWFGSEYFLMLFGSNNSYNSLKINLTEQPT